MELGGQGVILVGAGTNVIRARPHVSCPSSARRAKSRLKSTRDFVARNASGRPECRTAASLAAPGHDGEPGFLFAIHFDGGPQPRHHSMRTVDPVRRPVAVGHEFSSATVVRTAPCCAGPSSLRRRSGSEKSSRQVHHPHRHAPAPRRQAAASSSEPGGMSRAGQPRRSPHAPPASTHAAASRATDVRAAGFPPRRFPQSALQSPVASPDHTIESRCSAPRSSGPRNVCWKNSTVRHARRSAAAAGQAGTTIRRFHPRRRSRNRREAAQFERRAPLHDGGVSSPFCSNRCGMSSDSPPGIRATLLFEFIPEAFTISSFAQNPSDFSDNLVESDGTSPYCKLTLIKNSHNFHLSARH